VAGWWNDLYPAGSNLGAQSVSYQTLGTAPNRRFVVQFENVPHCCSSFPSENPVTFQFKLFEGSNVIEVHYTVALGGSTHSAGIENQAGNVGLQYFRSSSNLATPLAVRYSTAPLDTDADGVLDDVDNCRTIANPDQADTNLNGIGDACDDNDGIPDSLDNCPTAFNPDQADADLDGIGDACDPTLGAHAVFHDTDCFSNILPRNDDGSTVMVALPFQINFFGTRYNQVYVNNNGNLTFLEPMRTFTPFPIVTE
jgi:hypothetical protein